MWESGNLEDGVLGTRAVHRGFGRVRVVWGSGGVPGDSGDLGEGVPGESGCPWGTRGGGVLEGP